MKITFLTAFVCVILLKHSRQQCLTQNDQKIPSTQLTLYSGQQEFSFVFLQAIYKLNPNENIFFSPYSTYHALLLTYFISSSQTENFLRELLRLDSSQDKVDIFSAYKLDSFVTTFRAKNSSYGFTKANRIYVADHKNLRDCITLMFNKELIKKDFKTSPETARIDINRWVEEFTHAKIKALLPLGSIDASTNLALVNAAYFKGQWERKFDLRETRQEVFYITPSKHIIVAMMYIEASFNYDVSDTLMAHILEIPYEGDDISMYILLPPFVKEDGIETVLKRLTAETFRSVVNEFTLPRQVKLSLPKFSLEHTTELRPVLEEIGIGDLFQSTANFSTLSKSDHLSFGNALHKAKIEVSEQGTKAPSRAYIIFRTNPVKPVVYKCNHPFIYLIFDKNAQSILFIGVFRRPY